MRVAGQGSPTESVAIGHGLCYPSVADSVGTPSRVRCRSVSALSSPEVGATAAGLWSNSDRRLLAISKSWPKPHRARWGGGREGMVRWESL